MAASICLTIGYICRTCRLMVFAARPGSSIHYTHVHAHISISNPKKAPARLTGVIDSP